MRAAFGPTLESFPVDKCRTAVRRSVEWATGSATATPKTIGPGPNAMGLDDCKGIMRRILADALFALGGQFYAAVRETGTSAPVPFYLALSPPRVEVDAMPPHEQARFVDMRVRLKEWHDVFVDVYGRLRAELHRQIDAAVRRIDMREDLVWYGFALLVLDLSGDLENGTPTRQQVQAAFTAGFSAEEPEDAEMPFSVEVSVGGQSS